MADRAEWGRDGDFMSDPQQTPDAETGSAPLKPSWNARVRGWTGSAVRSTPARVLGLLGAFVAVTTAVVWLATQWIQREPLIEHVELAEALEFLDAGEVEMARDRAAKLFAHGGAPETDLPGALFIFGAALAHDARVTDDTDQQRRLQMMASRYLEEAHRRGWPAGRETEGLVKLSRSLYESGRYAKALPYLREGLQREGDHQIEQQRLLVEAYVRDDAGNHAAMLALYQRAMELLRRAIELDRHHEAPSRIASYLIGVCMAGLGDADAALAQFARTASADQNTPEGLAAGLEEAEGYLSKGRDESALEAFRRLLQRAGSPETFSNPWVSLDGFRKRIEGAFQVLLERREFELAVDLTRTMSPLVPDETSVRLRADALFELGDCQGAMEEYSLAINRIPQGPITLEAMVQIANCHRRLAQNDEARGTIKQT